MTTSIRTRLTLLFIGLAIGPLILLGLLLGSRSFRHQQQQSLLLQQAQARRVAAEVLAFTRQIETELNLVIQMQDLDTLDEDGTIAILAQLPVLDHTIQSLYLLDRQGEQILHVARIGIVNESSAISWRERDEFMVPVTGVIFYSPIQFDSSTNEPMMHIAQPVFNVRTGAVDGVLVADIRVKPIWDLIAGIRVSEGESIYIVDDQGRVVAHRNPSVVLRMIMTDLPATDGFYSGLFGDEVVLAMEPVLLGEQEFVVVAEKLRTEALALAIDTVRSTMMVTAFVLLLASITGVAVVRQIVRPIEELATTAQAIEAGDLSRQAPVTTTDEIGALAHAFNEMTQQLRQSLEELRYSEERYRELFENANDIVYTHDLVGNFLTVNRQAERVSGYSRDELLLMKVGHLINRADQAATREIFEENLQRREVATYEVQMVAKNGRIIPLEISSRYIYENGRASAIQSIARDISERKQAETALRKSEARIRALINAIPDLMFRLSGDGVFLDYYVSDDQALYLEPSQFIGKRINEIFPADLAQASQACIDRALTSGEVQILEYQLQMPNGVQDYEARYMVSGENEVLSVVRDITEKKRVAESMYQAQKLESIGVLAGGIAHDFNNLLTGMMAQNSLALAKLPAGEPAHTHIEKATQAAHRAADLTRQLLAYAGKGQFQIGLLDLNDLVQENVELLETVMPTQAKLKCDLATNLPAVEADKGQIQQLVMNLVMNAAEAIESKQGVVTVSTRFYELARDHEEAFVGNERPVGGQYVLLQVADTGVGMSQETLNAMFDPFFSTKMLGRGLGLSATLGIIQTHKGGLQVESVLGQGTTFRVYLPAISKPEVMAESAPIVPTKAAGGLILVIDDEEPVREAVTDVLEVMGIQVLTAANGREGITLFQQHQHEIGLVLLDMQMPVMSGEEAFSVLRELQSDVKVILSSGYSEIEALRRFNGRSINSFLQKPYDLKTLVAKVQAVLSS